MKQDLLFSILAAQNGMIKPEDLIEIGSAWVANQKKGLKERLCERLSREDIELLEKLVTRSLAKCGGDVDRSIQALHADDLLFKTLGGAIVVDVEPGKKEPCAAPVFCEKVTIESPDRYSMKVEVKRGGIGRIFVALDEHIGRNIAIKELLCEATDEGTVEEKFSTQASKSLRARFLREARVTGQLEHPAIVPVYEIGQRLDGACYYTMRYVKGSTLLDAIRKRTELSERLKLLPHFHDLCNAVAYAHSKGVVNRDIKSENVMIGEFGETVVLDWGLAKVKGQEDIGAERIEEGIQLIKDSDVGKTTIGHAIGTPAYMPPEQWRDVALV
ncbi:MAG TPA: serine/threonine-protein kinase, partial [bacterium]|nr:serine/threonine-protein kinase [bacterium]